MSSQTERTGNIIIVRRGFPPHFYFFCDIFARQHQATIVCDRRAMNRRLRHLRYFTNRRSDDRRGSPPASWQAGDFIWVPARP